MANQKIIDAIREDNYPGVKQAIKNGADLEQIIENELNENEETLLFYALHKKCSFETIKLLIDNGIDIDKTDSEGVSFFDEAIVLGDIELVRYLIEEKGRDVNLTKRKSGMTPLIQAACYGYKEIVIFLVSHGADISIVDNSGLDAIGYTRKLQRKPMQKYLEDISNK